MNKKILFFLSALIILFCTKTILAEGSGLLRDGFVLAGIDGKIENDKDTGKWFFLFSSDVSDDKGTVSAGSKLEILPSIALEKIEANIASHPENNFRLWAKITQFENNNYIYCIYFLPITETAPITAEQGAKVSINEPNDPLKMPDEIISKLKNRKIIRPEELEKPLELKEDSILADRTGFVKTVNNKNIFTLDGLGLSRGSISFELLPCETLQNSLGKHSDVTQDSRVKIAGIVTKYKNNYYLLLQRVVKVYNHGNFE